MFQPVYIPIIRKLSHYAPCPACGLHNDVDLDRCKHCSRTFSKEDKVKLLEHAVQQKRKGTRYATYVVAVLVVTLLIMKLFDFP